MQILNNNNTQSFVVRDKDSISKIKNIIDNFAFIELYAITLLN